MIPPNYPNPELHKQLLDAAKQKKLDAETIKKILQLPNLPHVARDATAYVNWDTTLTLLGPAPAKIWFAGVSKPEHPNIIHGKSQDIVRADLSVGVYFWWTDQKDITNMPNIQYHFWIEQDDILFIDIYSDNHLVALFDGTPTVNGELLPGPHEFIGDGLFSFSK